MSPLNDPVGYDEARGVDDWTPTRGLVRGALRGGIAAGVLAGLLAVLAVELPYAIIPLWVRAPLAFGVCWVLFQVVQRAAGMVGPPCTFLALGLAALVLLSNHVTFALHGVPVSEGVERWWVIPMSLVEEIVPARGDLLIGWSWCHPYAVLTLSGLPLVLGGGFCAALCRRG
jgi:hypothetical protein